MASVPWKVSLHGGHSGEFCEHAVGSLRATVRAALSSGLCTLGITEHAPRPETRFLYASERAKGYSVERLEQEFEEYAKTSADLQREFEGRLPILRGFETEAVPTSGYAGTMCTLRDQYAFDYTVGSVHHVAEISIDESPQLYAAAVSTCGGLEPFMERYYEIVREMIEVLRPEIVAHLDLPKLHAPVGADLSTSRIRRAAEGVIAAANRHDCILDLNTAAWRKGLPEPYPAPWLVRLATEAGVPFCFGDDSHSPAQVGFGLERARRYLLDNGVGSVTCLKRSGRFLAKQEIPLAV